jgi:hypothetical protein
VDVQNVVNGLSVERKFDAPEFSRYENEITVQRSLREEFEVDALISQLHERKDWRLGIWNIENILEGVPKTTYVCQGNSAAPESQDSFSTDASDKTGFFEWAILLDAILVRHDEDIGC